MKKLFISADIEGTADIMDWRETEKGDGEYAPFSEQMSREVAAACEGALDAGAEEIYVKDAHDSARNINHRLLPEKARLFRGWAGHPYCMMYGLDKSFDGVALTGYHSGAGWGGNPLSHTMTTEVFSVTLNGQSCCEAMISAWIAAYEGVPVRFLSGDQGLCDWMKDFAPNTVCVATNAGSGGGALAIHPDLAVKRIREGMRQAALLPAQECLLTLPKRFQSSITYKTHAKARSASFYPGASLQDERTVGFECEDFFELLRFYHFDL